jgi:hypothetical protein
MNQVFATFRPDPYGMFESEGGSYGECCAYNIYPTKYEIGEVANANFACFTWETSDKKQGNGPPTMPKTQMIPHPVVCPSNLGICYSMDWYTDDNSRMASSERLVPSFTGVWNSPKAIFPDGRNHYLWCHHRCGGCHVGNWNQLQTQNIGKLGCDYSQCKKYKGNVQPLSQLTIQPIGTFPAIGDDVCADYGSDSEREGGPSLSPPGYKSKFGSVCYPGKPCQEGSDSKGQGGQGGQDPPGYGKGGNKNGGSGSVGGGNGNGYGKGGNGSVGNGGGNKGSGGEKSTGSGSTGTGAGKGGSNNGSNAGKGSGSGSGTGTGTSTGKKHKKGKKPKKGNGSGNGAQEGHKRDCDKASKEGEGQHKHRKCKKENVSDNETTSENPAKREDDLDPIIRRHHIKEQRRNSIF